MPKTKIQWERPEELKGLPMQEWAAGPWMDEPWRYEWTYKGLRCLVLRGHSGSLCGYVRIPRMHPWYRIDYSGVCLERPSCKDKWCGHTLEASIEVHGGLTFSGGPFGTPRWWGGWWIGFDCNHLHDLAPGMEAQIRKLQGSKPPWQEGNVYRDMAYVTAEVCSMADQVLKVPRRSFFAAIWR